MLKLHIGCFDVPLAGWYNTDITMHIFVARIPFLAHVLCFLGLIDEKRFQQHREGVFRSVHFLNALKRFPFPDGTVGAVYSSCMLASFTRKKALECLKEINRVLRPGGILRLATPDLDHWIAAYNPDDPDSFLLRIFEPEINGEKNRIHWMYTSTSLRNILREAGFTNITSRERYQGKCPDVERIDYRSDVLFMESEK
jgi:SAM-dependent methyltransferase